MQDPDNQKPVSGSNSRLWIALFILSLIGLILAFAAHRTPPPPPVRIALMSTIDLQWGEADLAEVAQGKAHGSAFFTRLSQGRQIKMIEDIAKLPHSKVDALVMVQPRLLSPDEHVALDTWVRSGGRAIIFADPALQWPSKHPAGDPRHPLFTSMLGPLLKHWGLKLALPINGEEADASVSVGDQRIGTSAHGIWVTTADTAAASCQITPSRLLAQCRVGKGMAIVFADADMLSDERDVSIIGDGQIVWILGIVDDVARNNPLPSAIWEFKGK